jgi:hypothetical protein
MQCLLTPTPSHKAHRQSIAHVFPARGAVLVVGDVDWVFAARATKEERDLRTILHHPAKQL